MKLIPITPEAQFNKYWQRFTSYSFARSSQLATLVAAELRPALQSLPLAFVQQQERLYIVAVLGVDPGENLYVNELGQWEGGYIPSTFRGYPFKLARKEEQLILCVDEESGLISEQGGEPFFDENGALAQPTRKVMDFLTKVEQNRYVTQQAVDALSEAGVLVQWDPVVRTENEERTIPGLFRVDEKAMNQLDDQAFLALRSAHALSLAYAQLYSMINIQILAKLYESKKKEQQKVQDFDVEMLFGDDDIIRF